MRNKARDLLLLMNNKEPTYLNFSATTTAPNETLTLQSIRATGVGITIDWGDGTATDYASGYIGTHTHIYANAGTYLVRVICDISLIYHLDLQDNKITWIVSPTAPIPAGLTYLYLYNLPDLTWTVDASAPMPAELTSLYLINLPDLTWPVSLSAPVPANLKNLQMHSLAGLTWEVSATTPMPAELTFLYLYNLVNLTWEVSATAPVPEELTFLNFNSLVGLTWTVSPSTPVPARLISFYMYNLVGLIWEVNTTNPIPNLATTVIIVNCPGLIFASGAWTATTKSGPRTYQFENAHSAAQMDTCVAELYAQRASFTGSGALSLDILGGGNAAPTGTYQAQVPPTTGKEYIYELVNDSANEGYKKWTVQYQT